MKRKPLPEGAPGEVEPDNDVDDGPMSPKSMVPTKGPGSALMSAIGQKKKRGATYGVPPMMGK